MSVPTDFISRFCQNAPSPIVYSKQDVVDDFIKFIETECASQNSSDKIITYKMPKKFLSSFSRENFWNIIYSILVNQMGFSKSTYRFTFGHEYVYMKPKTFHYIKTGTRFQYNEEYEYEEWCDFHCIPDGIVMKFYVA